MDIDNRKILIGIVIITLLLIPVVAFTSGALRIALGLPFALIFPGYTLLSAISPKKGSFSGIERIALSLGLSIAVIALIGVLFNYTPWGIGLYTTLIPITLFILIASGIAWYRQRKLPATECLSFTVHLSLPKWGKTRSLDKALYISLAVALIAALGSLGYVFAVPKGGQSFSEFYILGSEGKAEDYPQKVMLGEAVELTVGIVNHEYEPSSYQIDIRIEGTKVEEIRSPRLAHEERWEEVVSFVPQSPGKNQKVDFWLYKEGNNVPYLKSPLHLYLNVIEPPAQ